MHRTWPDGIVMGNAQWLAAAAIPTSWPSFSDGLRLSRFCRGTRQCRSHLRPRRSPTQILRGQSNSYTCFFFFTKQATIYGLATDAARVERVIMALYVFSQIRVCFPRIRMCVETHINDQDIEQRRSNEIGANIFYKVCKDIRLNDAAFN